jgi:hypothetical protein
MESGPALGPTLSPIQEYRRLFTGANRLGCEAVHLPPYNADVKNARNTRPLPHKCPWCGT